MALGSAVLELLPERAVWWDEASTLFVADLHVGKDEALRVEGLAIPEGPTEDDLERLADLTAVRHPRRVVVLGDFLHARSSRSARIRDLLGNWRASLDADEVILVRGNHDRSAGDPFVEAGIRVVEEPSHAAPLTWVHDPDLLWNTRSARHGGPGLAGHLHPARRVAPGRRLPAFWLRRGVLVLPAFSRFTAGSRVTAQAGDRCWVVADQEVVEVPPQGV